MRLNIFISFFRLLPSASARLTGSDGHISRRNKEEEGEREEEEGGGGGERVEEREGERGNDNSDNPSVEEYRSALP